MDKLGSSPAGASLSVTVPVSCCRRFGDGCDVVLVVEEEQALPLFSSHHNHQLCSITTSSSSTTATIIVVFILNFVLYANLTVVSARTIPIGKEISMALVDMILSSTVPNLLTN